MELVRYDALEGTDGLPDATKPLSEQLQDITAKEARLSQQLEDINRLWQSQVEPIQAELASLSRQKTWLAGQIHLAEHGGHAATPPGPETFKWVDSHWLFDITTLVVIINVVVMVLEKEYPSTATAVFDHLFLAWYIFELLVRGIYHQRQLFLGEPSVVWWNWLDLLIVLTSIVEQWFVPLLSGTTGHSTAGYLRLLRLFRLVRVLKLLGVFLHSDLSWADGHHFESFIGAVISVNAVILGLQQDIEWAGWLWIENIFLLIYFFELSIKLKRWGFHFFTHRDFWAWNNLDFVIVGSGVLDMWAVPAFQFVMSLIYGNWHGASRHGMLTALRIARIMRVFRLVRLVKNIKPLHRLMLGIAEGLGAMFWVLILSVITLYALGIVFTSLVNEGYLFVHTESEEAEAMFGTVLHSMYALFKLMNDDQSVVDSITGTPAGMLLFVVAMIISNWALLAVLTSVVSDNMIASSVRHTNEEATLTAEETKRRVRSQLEYIFGKIDHDKIGIIDEAEWQELMSDSGRCSVLEAASMRPAESLQDLFQCLADSDEKKKFGRLKDTPHRTLEYNLLLDEIESETQSADRKSVLALMVRMGAMDRRIEQRLDHLIKNQPVQNAAQPRFEARHVSFPRRSTSFSAAADRSPIN